MATAEHHFTAEETRAIKVAIEAAEQRTSGEICVHIEKHSNSEEVLDRAAEVFADLELHRTKQRNGVLIYLAIEDHQFAILGDKAINAVVEPDFWESVKEAMLQHFKNSRFTEGLVTGIKLAGEKLSAHFPFVAGEDKNELSDEISFG